MPAAGFPVASTATSTAAGSQASLPEVTKRVRAMHGRARGVLDRDAGPFPAGTAYAADDPALLMWVLFTLVDSGIVVYERFVAGLDRDEKERYWADFRVVGSLFGLADSDMPADLDGLDRYRDEIYASGDLHVSDWARDQARSIVFEPPVPIRLRPLVEAVNFITVALLPAPIRDQYRFSPLPPLPVRRLAVNAYAEYLKRAVLPLLPGRLRRIPVG